MNYLNSFLFSFQSAFVLAIYYCLRIKLIICTFDFLKFVSAVHAWSIFLHIKLNHFLKMHQINWIHIKMMNSLHCPTILISMGKWNGCFFLLLKQASSVSTFQQLSSDASIFYYLYVSLTKWQTVRQNHSTKYRNRK